MVRSTEMWNIERGRTFVSEGEVMLVSGSANPSPCSNQCKWL